ncbi:MAG: hypothetical protein AABZ74_12625 [Cyanobacteriota bacterium]
MLNKKWVNLSLFYFSSIAIIGCLIRYGFFSGNFLTNYKYLLHTHSHIAFLGWIYPCLFILIVNSFLSSEEIIKGRYKLQFYITQILIILMFIAFLIQGYAFFSILFSSLFQLMTYSFAFRFFKDSKKSVNKKLLSIKFIRIGLLSLVISSIGTWFLPITILKHLNETNWYNSAIYFYLHFQYNGWFLFALLGIFYKFLEKNKINYNIKNANISFISLSISIVPSYFLSILGLTENMLIKEIAFVGSFFEIIAIIYFLKTIFKEKEVISNTIKTVSEKTIFLASISALVIKIGLQFLSNFSYFHQLSFSNRFIVLSYLHLTLIGFTSFFLIFLLSQNNYISLNKQISKIGITSLLFGFITSESFLTLGGLGFNINNVMILIFIFSLFMALGIILIFFDNIISSNKLEIKN